MSKYEQLKDNEISIIDPEKQILRFACCDCGLVHDYKFIINKGKIEMAIRRHNRATAQLRKNGYGYLSLVDPKSSLKWKMVRINAESLTR